MNTHLFPAMQLLFQDDALVVLNKPAGVVVNRAESVKEPTIQDWAERQSWFPRISDAAGEEERIYQLRSGVAHRLDKDTSGVLVLAKTPQALTALMRQFRERETQKRYIALVHGKMSVTEGVIRLPLARSSRMRERFAVDPEGKLSETAYRVLAFYPHPPNAVPSKEWKRYQGFSLLELLPKTGRTHQIRVHMHHLAHPLVGDHLYAGRKRDKLDRTWCPRQFLHAAELCFFHPVEHKRMCVEAPLAEDLQHILEQLQDTVQ